MKIVFVVGGLLRPDGMSQVLSDIINYLAENTHFNIYMILTEKAGEPWFYEISPKVKFINFNLNFDDLDNMPLPKKLIQFWKKQKKYKKLFANYLMEIRPDITVSELRREINFINEINDGSKKIAKIHFNKSNYREANIKYFPHFINLLITKKWQADLVKHIRKLDRFIVLTEEDKKAWVELKNIMVIPNALKFIPTESSKCINKKVIAVGRYSPEKGFDRLIDAWAIVNNKHNDWKLDIYGSGNRFAYQKLAADKGLTNSISCNEATKNIYDKYMESSVFVLSSRYEGFGLALAEAMSCGLAVASFACPCGPIDIIKDGEDGFLVENGNTAQLAEKICYLIEHEDERIAMGKRAKEDVQRFSKEKIMQQWIDLFNELTKEKQ